MTDLVEQAKRDLCFAYMLELLDLKNPDAEREMWEIVARVIEFHGVIPR